MSPPLRARIRGGAAIVIATLLAGNLLLSFGRAAKGGIAVDYLAFATGGRLIGSAPQHLYDIAAQADTQAQLLGYRPVASPSFPANYANPPFVAELIRPLAELPLQLGTDIFCVLLLLATAIAALLVWRRMPTDRSRVERIAATALLAASTATAYGVLLGQWSPLLVPISLAALMIIEGGRAILGGVVLGLLLIKPQTVWLVLPGLVVLRRWDIAAGFAIGGAFLASISLALVGFSGANQYLNFLRIYATSQVTVVGRSIPDVVAYLTGDTALVTGLSLLCGGAALLGLWLVARRRSISGAATVATLVLLSLLTSGHVNPQDFALALGLPFLLIRSHFNAVIAIALVFNLGAAFEASMIHLQLDTVALLIGVVVAATVCWREAFSGYVKLGLTSAR